MILSCSFLQIILGHPLAAVGLNRALFDLMPSLPQVAHSACQSEALEPFQSLQSRDRSACLEVGEDASVLVVAFRLYWVTGSHEGKLKLLCL